MAFNFSSNPKTQALIDFLKKSWSDKWSEEASTVFREYFESTERYRKLSVNSIGIFPSTAKMGDGKSCCFLALTRPDATNGPYSGTSLVVFPSVNGKSVVTLCLGTKGLGRDAGAVGLPGHARRLSAMRWYVNDSLAEANAMWVKKNPCKMEPLPRKIEEWIKGIEDGDSYGPMIDKYGQWLYAIIDVDKFSDDERLLAAVCMLFDFYMAVRGEKTNANGTKGEFGSDSLRHKYESFLFQPLTEEKIKEDLEEKHYLIIEGPPGTGKTLAAQKLKKEYGAEASMTVQFHPNMTYEQFVGGIFPEKEDKSSMGFRFKPTPGILMKAIKRARDLAAKDSAKKFLLHIDEINRADLSRVLGEAIYLFEANADRGTGAVERHIDLDYDFGDECEKDASGNSILTMPENLHVVGTMNSSDRSIAPIDIAIRRRFAFETLYPQIQVVQDIPDEKSDSAGGLYFVDGNEKELAVNAFCDLIGSFIDYATEESFKYLPGHSYFLPTRDGKIKNKIRTGVLPLLREYLEKDMVSSMSSQIEDYIATYESLCK